MPLIDNTLKLNQKITNIPKRLKISELKEGVIYPLRTEKGKNLIVVVLDGELNAYLAQCPHMGADLIKAKCVGPSKNIQCPWHGYIFDSRNGNFLLNPNVESMKNIRIPSDNFDPNLIIKFKLRSVQLTTSDDWCFSDN